MTKTTAKRRSKNLLPKTKKDPSSKSSSSVFSNRRIFVCENQGQKKPNFLETFVCCFLLVLNVKRTQKNEKKGEDPTHHYTLNAAQSRRLYQNCHHPHQKCFLDKKKKKTAQKKTDCFCKEDKEEGDQNNCRGRRSRTTFTNSKKVRYNNNKQQQHHQRV